MEYLRSDMEQQQIKNIKYNGDEIKRNQAYVVLVLNYSISLDRCMFVVLEYITKENQQANYYYKEFNQGYLWHL
jgi:hypothetical protein